MAVSQVTVGEVEKKLHDSLTPLGFEVYLFKIGWYNALLSASLHLPYPDDTLAVVVLSTPDMFEQVFKPFLKRDACKGVRDPIDQCVAHCISSCVSQCFADLPVDICYDYEMLPSRKPRFLAQTAAHVAGAAYYYQRSDVTDDPWGDRKMFGVCIHPRLGGWFAIRALLVFPGLEVGVELQQRPPPDCVPSQKSRVELLERFNFHWRDWSYRNIIPTSQCYSEEQQMYFSTPPGQREALLRKWGFLESQDTGL
ncbi:cyanocobalamin reductase / alkylcobalamin dealkylase [Brienomyrus brachyistius]|uniref:cyanocobalamin reductase / alkylcobalamin dealkylase n=1 Tax=Brienomyrus brachyistius TaxID=42636 RepID=UPI0020B38D22|nr:cyanocobalamin reductase / alkylcobalamin dealkylase [Brienomyrus brachyistius]